MLPLQVLCWFLEFTSMITLAGDFECGWPGTLFAQELPSVSTTSVQNSVRTTEVGLLPSSPESVASARAWAHQWMLAANGSTSAAPALRSALRCERDN